MSDEMRLSQAEIDALLNNNPLDAADTDEVLTADEKDAIGEIGNICFGAAATSLSTLLQHRVSITTPEVTVIRKDKLHDDFPKPYVLLVIEFSSGVEGVNALAIEIEDAKTIADLMLGGDGHPVAEELNELHLSAVAEAMNQMMGGAATALSSLLDRPVNISPPRIEMVDLSTANSLDLGRSNWLVNAVFNIKIGDLIDSKLMQLQPLALAKELASKLLGQAQSPVSVASVNAAPSRPLNTASPMQGSQQDLGSPMSRNRESQELFAERQNLTSTAAGDENLSGNAASKQEPPAQSAKQVLRPEFVDFSPSGSHVVGLPNNLELLYDVSLNVTVELGRTRRSIRELLDLVSGSILELDKLAGEPVDILVNNKRIAIGEVVVIDENFGVRVTDIISPVERIRSVQ